jgi:hypothetical protein
VALRARESGNIPTSPTCKPGVAPVVVLDGVGSLPIMRRFAFFFVFIAACGGREPAPASPAHDAAQAPGYASPPQGQPAPGEPEMYRAPSPPDAGTVHSGDTISTPEDALAIIEAESQRLDEAFSADQLSTSCDRVCRALGSMRRAVDGLCDLTGDDDDRCERARGRLAANEAKVSGAGCGC